VLERALVRVTARLDLLAVADAEPEQDRPRKLSSSVRVAVTAVTGSRPQMLAMPAQKAIRDVPPRITAAFENISRVPRPSPVQTAP